MARFEQKEAQSGFDYIPLRTDAVTSTKRAHMANGTQAFTPIDTVKYIWNRLSLPANALHSLHLDDSAVGYPSSFKIGHVAQAAIALSALSAALVDSLRDNRDGSVRHVTVPLHRACLQFKTETLYTLNGQKPKDAWGTIGGLHHAKDGWVRIHDSFLHHRLGTLRLLGLPADASREDVSAKVCKWEKLQLEQEAHRNHLVIYALRSYAEWDATPQAQAVADFPIIVRRIDETPPMPLPERMQAKNDRCLRGLRVLELSRVIAAPVAGKTLASHGADLLWVTSPNLPDLPALDRTLSCGKRTIQLNLDEESDRETLRTLARECDVFIQGYRPQSLSQRGFGAAALAKLRPGIIYANMSAFGPDGPWANRRGFDSLVQTCSGMNHSEAEHFGAREAARPMPCQALDHAAGYLLATGISAALYRRVTEGGSWEVHVSLAAVMRYLRNLGQWPGREGFDCPNPAANMGDIPGDFFEEHATTFGVLKSLSNAPAIEGAMPGFDHTTRLLGSDEPCWL